MKYYLRTYGCQMNVYDSELVMGILNGEGHIRTSMLDEADIIIINTCSVRQNAENRVLNKLDQLKHLKVKNPQLIVGVIGCVAQNLKKAIIENRQFINFVLGPDSYRKIPEIIKNLKSSESAFVEVGLSRSETYDYLYPARGESVNAWIAIMRGCNRFCSFCIVPYLRGRERSKPAARVLDEVKRAANEGYAEITLLGQNVNAYRDGRVDFPDLLKMIADVDGIKRIRFTSPHPQDMSLKLIKTIAEVSKICNHIHLPVQAGSDKILSLMNRNYSRNEYISLVDRIRSFISGVSITTDIIAGFPGETREDFLLSVELMQRVEFDNAFTFKYSPRKGTKAAKLKDDVPEIEKVKRVMELAELQRRITLKKNRNLIGRTVEVLVEKESKKSASHWMGRTEENKIVVFPKNGFKQGEFAYLQIVDADGVTLFGKN